MMRYPELFRARHAVMVSAAVLVLLWGGAVFCAPPESADKRPASAANAKEPSAPQSLEGQVRSIFQKQCTRCHGKKTQKSELNLSTPQGIRKGGDSGPVIVPGKPDESLLYELVHDGMMPPNKKQRLSKEDVATIRKWIAGGARFRRAAASVAREVTHHDIIPLLNLRCTVCHGLRRREAGLDLRSKASMLKGGKSGPAFVPGKPAESLMLKRIHAEEMPPRHRLVEASIKTMELQEIRLLTEWIARGAVESPLQPDVATSEPDPLVSDEDRKFWSFQPARAVPVPRVTQTDRLRNPIDAFVLRKLEAKGLSLSPAADRLTLLRRAYFDLIGLPPEPDLVEAFLADKDPQAYEKLIDRLLSSPRYGERWGRYWLDLAGYADSEGKREQDVIRPYAYRYRDYVVRSYNADKPYDRFLTEQLAGDELADYENAKIVTQQMYDNLVATGFLRMAPDSTLADITNFVPDRLEVVADELQVFGSVVLGLTLQCARCHNHKFDPLPQRDYYRLVDTLKGAFDVHDWLKPQTAGLRRVVKENEQRLLSYVTTAERQAWLAHDQQLTTQLRVLADVLRQKEETLRQKTTEQRLEKLPKALHDDLRKMLATPGEKRNEIQKYLASKFEKRLRPDVEELKKIDAGFKTAAEETKRQTAALEAKRTPEPRIRALWDRGEPSPTYILRRGNYLTPGRLVGPGVPSVLTDGTTPFTVKPAWSGATKTGRRLALARWLTQKDHPLTARVMVNRIWKHHFGTGIVTTPANFGRAGDRPSHPELLDWLAVEFIRQGWRIKALHRLMMTSATYRQSSRVTPTPRQKQLDPAGRLFSRAPLRRMEAEVLRDTLLLISGKLNGTPFGPPDKVEVRSDGLVTSLGGVNGWRRSIYVRQRRKQLPTILEVFDLPQMNPNCIERSTSTVTPQALFLLNNKMVRQLADSFATRVIADTGTEPQRQIDRVYLIALSRFPTPQEKQLAEKTLARLTTQWSRQLADESQSAQPPAAFNPPAALNQRAAARALGNLCHAVMNSAALMYVD